MSESTVLVGRICMSYENFMFKVDGNPTRRESEDLCGIWEWGLWNDHVHADRFMLGDDTCAYLFKVSLFCALCTQDY